jgi:hypothetical protein
MFNSYTVHKFSDSYQIVDLAELSGSVTAGRKMITCSPDYIWAPAKDKTALLSD